MLSTMPAVRPAWMWTWMSKTSWKRSPSCCGPPRPSPGWSLQPGLLQFCVSLSKLPSARPAAPACHSDRVGVCLNVVGAGRPGVLSLRPAVVVSLVRGESGPGPAGPRPLAGVPVHRFSSPGPRGLRVFSGGTCAGRGSGRRGPASGWHWAAVSPGTCSQQALMARGRPRQQRASPRRIPPSRTGSAGGTGSRRAAGSGWAAPRGRAAMAAAVRSGSGAALSRSWVYG